MNDDELVPDDDVPVEAIDDPLEPTPEFGEHDEEAQKEEWEEDAREGGSRKVASRWHG